MERATIQTKHGVLSGYKTPFGVIALVRPWMLTMDADYQRPYIEKWAEEIAEEWDNARARPVNARLRDGKLYITNGQHTVGAAKIVGVEELLVIVNNGSPSRTNEAREFVAFQMRAKRMRPFDVYRASLVAKDADALIVRKVMNDLGIEIVPNRPKSPDELSSVTAARHVAQPENGTKTGLAEAEQRLRDVLEVAMVWEDNNRFKSELLSGIEDALEARDKSLVLINAKRFSTGDALYQKANTEARGRGYRTIDLIALYLTRKPRKKQPQSAVHLE